MVRWPVFIMRINKNFITFITLVFLFLTAFIFLTKYIQVDKTPPHWDFALHLNNSLIYYENLKEFNLIKIFLTYVFYPPLTYLFLALFFLILGYSKITLLIFNFFLLALLSFVVYRFVRKIFGTFTAFISLGLVWILVLINKPGGILIWELMLDYPLMIIVFISYCLFYLSFKNKNFSFNKSVQIGLLCGGTLLIKWSAIVYLIIPIGFYLFLAFKNGHFRKTWPLFLSFIFLAGIWYLPHFKLLLGDLQMFGITQGSIDQDPQGFKSMVFYLKNFYFTTEPLIFIIPICFLLGLSKIFKGKTFKKNWEVLFNWLFLLFPFLFFSLLTPNKDIRYLYPFYILSIMISLWQINRYFDFKKIWPVFPSILILITASFPFTLPSPTAESLISKVERILLEENPKTVAYFFESDSSSFNYANIRLFHHQFRLENKSYPVNFYLNQMNTLDNQVIHGCRFLDLPEVIFVFKENKFISSDYQWQASFEKDCPEKFRQNYQIQEKFKFNEEEIFYLTKIH